MKKIKVIEVSSDTNIGISPSKSGAEGNFSQSFLSVSTLNPNLTP